MTNLRKIGIIRFGVVQNMPLRFLIPILHVTSIHLSGATNDCFLYNICSEKQILPRIFFCLRTAKNFQMNVPFKYIFEADLINSLRFSEVYFFIFYYPGYTIFLRKGNLKFSDSKM